MTNSDEPGSLGGEPMPSNESASASLKTLLVLSSTLFPIAAIVIAARPAPMRSAGREHEMRFVLDHVRFAFLMLDRKNESFRLRTASWQPRCLRNASVRPVALRPRLSESLPRARADAAQSLPISQAIGSLSADTADRDTLNKKNPPGLCCKRAKKGL